MINAKTCHPRRTGKTMRGSAICALFFFFVSALAHAQVQVSATVDRNALNPEDSLTLTVSVDSNEEAMVTSPKLPVLHDFEMLNEWTSQSQQASMRSTPQGPQFIKTFSTKYNYMLQPKRQGMLTIGSIDVIVNGANYTTRPIVVKVAPGAGLQARPGNNRRNDPRHGAPPGSRGRGGANPPPGFEDDEDDDLFSQLLRRVQPPSAGSRTLPINPQEAFFIQVETDKAEAYEGEQVTTSFYLYTRGLIRDLDTLKYPSLRGFWKEDIEIATHLNFESEVVNGVPYKKALLASFALFPRKEGTATVDPYTARCSVIPSVDGFGFGLGKAYTFTKSSMPVKIKVKPVPSEGRPADYSGAVGDFSVTARIEDKNIVEGQPLTLKIRFEGRGNAKTIDLPPFEPPAGLELYDQQNEARFFRTGASYKEFRVLMIPRREGEFTIPALTVSIFDPVQKTFVKKATEPLAFRAGKGSVSGTQGLNVQVGQDNVKKGPSEPRLITDFRPSMAASTAQSVAGWTAVYALIATILVWRARSELGWGQKKKDLMRQLKARLRRVESRAQAGDWRGVGTEMTNTVYFVLGSITNEGGAHLELEKLLLKAPPSVRREIGEPLAKQMEVFHVLTFAPEGVVGELKDPASLKKSIDSMEKLMAKAVYLAMSAEQSDQSEPDPKAS